VDAEGRFVPADAQPGKVALTMFASRTVVGHLMRGGIAAALIAWALLHQASDPVFAVAAIVLAVVAMRGCPLCWTLGLVETIANRSRLFGS
jgi:hypothetical protein